MAQVPYRGSTPALTDVLAGNISMMFVDLTPAQQLIAEGKIRAFGITSMERATPAPEIPTISEAGLPGYSGVAWNAVITKRGTPRPIIDLLNKAISDYVQRPEITQKVYFNGIKPVVGSVDEFAKFIVDEREKWSKVIADAGIPKVD
jgi:tripartite-type tricarboxylate transporter receptor subunit TctC